MMTVSGLFGGVEPPGGVLGDVQVEAGEDRTSCGS